MNDSETAPLSIVTEDAENALGTNSHADAPDDGNGQLLDNRAVQDEDDDCESMKVLKSETRQNVGDSQSQDQSVSVQQDIHQQGERNAEGQALEGLRRNCHPVVPTLSKGIHYSADVCAPEDNDKLGKDHAREIVKTETRTPSENPMPSTRRASTGERLGSSLDLRKLPMDICFDNQQKASEFEFSEFGGDDESVMPTKTDFGDDKKDTRSFTLSGLVHALCLSPKYKLKTQLMLSFGSVNLITVTLVFIGCIVATYLVGEKVKSINQEAFQDKLVPEIEARTARYLAESLERQFMPLDLIDLLSEAVQDRFQGYPGSMLNETDSRVPFKDILTGKNVYPLVGEPLRLDWQVPPGDLTEENYKEHARQNQWDTFLRLQRVASTQRAQFFIQGQCDPNDTNETSPFFLPNCTDANNDVDTGGAIFPVPTAGPIYRAGSDLSPLLKAIYETKAEIRDLGVYVKSMGAGASFSFPQYPADSQTTYPSIGCDWMATPNPIDPSLGPIGTPDEISRCHPDGEAVSARLYNPMERRWCRDVALKPHTTVVDSYIGAWTKQWLLSIARAVYDRDTNELVGCVYLGTTLSLIEQVLKESIVTQNSELTLIKFDEDGTVISSTAVDTKDGETDSDVLTIDELNVGLNHDSYQNLRSLYSSIGETIWSPFEFRLATEKFSNSMVGDGYLVAVSPMPRIPDIYDPDYKPAFFVVMSTATEDVFAGVQQLNDDVDTHVDRVFWFSIIAGAIGFCATAFVILLMSNTLTSPLRYINDSADDIVRSVGQSNSPDANIDEDNMETEFPNNKMKREPNFVLTQNLSKSRRLFHFGRTLTPKTELDDVLREFKKMVENFSGSLMVKSEKGRKVEVRNSFDLRREFGELYDSRKSSSFVYKLQVEATDLLDRDDDYNTNACVVDDNTENRLGYIHLGSNLESRSRTDNSNSLRDASIRGVKRTRSPLFFWTAALIVTPLFLTTITISVAALLSVRYVFQQTLQDAKAYFLDIELNALSVHAKLRADFVASLTEVPVRDTYFVTRYVGWVLFGGVKRADSFTEMLTGTEACKNHTRDITACPFFQENYACDCSWNDVRGLSCQGFSGSTRHLQRVDFSVEYSEGSQDGDRISTDYPRVSTSPQSTRWWTNVTTVPGWEKGPAASGYDTLYDRLRVSSAVPIFPALYNYDKYKRNFIGQHIGFEADGAFLGYNGCAQVGNSLNAGWQSTLENGAAEMRPELCPVGKHGYDPRCRAWYHVGRKLSMEKNTSLHITAPYSFAILSANGQSITMPLVDPKSGEHVGQVLYDFYSNTVLDVLNNASTPLAKGGFPMLVAIQTDFDENTILGPGFTIGDEPKAISEVVLSSDLKCSRQSCAQRVLKFYQIADSMNRGESNSSTFMRTNEDGVVETMYVAYAPIKVESIRPVDPSDFGRGVDVQEYFVYSLGLCVSEAGLLEPFKEIEKKIAWYIGWAFVGVATAVGLAAVLIIYFSAVVTASIAEPMQYLLNLIRCINRNDFDGEPPRFEGSPGSKEMVMVSDTILVLYKIVRAANDFFFAGELHICYLVLRDALALFKKLKNKKAVAIACNNIGNTMLAMYREMKALGLERHCGLTKQEIIAKGTGHFHLAIKLGKKAYDEFYLAEGWTPNCLDFMQHLSNRYFNRALFLLTVKDDTKQPADTEKLGMRDLEIARDMDLEIIEYGEDVGFNQSNRAHKVFQANLIRARGHNILLGLGYPDGLMQEKGYPDDWELGQMLDEIFQLLQKENEQPSSELFNDMNVLGRLQEVETELMKYNMLTGDLECAARIAIRMLFEDAMIFAEALATSLQVMVMYTKTMDLDDVTRARIEQDIVSYAEQLDRDLEFLDEETRNSTTIAAGSALESLSEEVTSRISQLVMEGSGTLKKSGSRINWVKHLSSGDFVTMEDF